MQQQDDAGCLQQATVQVLKHKLKICTKCAQYTDFSILMTVDIAAQYSTTHSSSTSTALEWPDTEAGHAFAVNQTFLECDS